MPARGSHRLLSKTLALGLTGEVSLLGRGLAFEASQGLLRGPFFIREREKPIRRHLLSSSAAAEIQQLQAL